MNTIIDLLSAQRYSLAAVVRIVGQQDAEDVLQEAALLAWKKRKSFRGESRFETWFFKIAVNAALMRLRPRVLSDRNSVELFDVYESSEPTPERRAEQAEAARKLYDAISRLSTRKRKLAALRWLAGETARGSEKAARHKAKQQLRDMLVTGSAA